jgi:catechol 2,3-dioxygenase-like lactoylglutathione lyase family enzyme
MHAGVDQLVEQYERGTISRRELLAALTMLVAGAAQTPAAAARAPIGAVKHMNHVTVFVPDVKKSVQFYQDLFGLPLLTRQDPGINLSTGVGFLGIYPTQGGAGGGSINHLCFGMENFDADAVLKRLTDRGVKASIRLRGDTKELYFTDPDGIRVQLQDVRYKGGTGPLGDRDPA